jgi:Domain of unknown function (DUF4175)
MQEYLADTPNQKVLDSLEKVCRGRTLARVREGGILSLSVLVLAILSSTILELLFNPGTVGRGIIVLLSLGTVIFTTLRYFVPHIFRYFGPPKTEEVLRAALEVGGAYPDLKDRLRNAVELLSTGGRTYHSEELARAYIAQIFEQASTLDMASALSYKTSKMPVVLFASSLVAALLLFVSFPSQSASAFLRVVNFTHKYEIPDPFSIIVLPGNAQLSRGDTLTIETELSLSTATRFPSYIVVNERYDGEMEFEKHQVKESEAGKYYFRLPNVRSSLEYYVAAGDQTSPEYRVNVVDLPIVQDFRITLDYPPYTGKAPETLQENIGDFSAVVGTRAEYWLRTNKSLKFAWIAFNDSSRRELKISASNADGSFIVKSDVRYTLRLLDTDSLQNRDPIVYAVQAVKDEYPTCEITSPGKDADLNRDMQLPLRISIGDDYGFTKLLLQYKLASSKYVPPERDYHSIEIPLPSRAAGQEDISYLWDLTSLNLVPEDVISYHATVFDNDIVDGPKSTASAEYTLRLPSLEEVFASADSEHSGLVTKTEDALNSSDELKNQLDKISEEMKTATRQMSWEQKKKMENTLQRYDSLQKKIEGVKREIENMTQKMLENKIISPQTLEKYLELQKALQDVDSPEFQDALKKLQQAIQSLNPNLVRQAMQNFKINEDMLRKSIERTLSLIKRVQIEQKLDELMRRTDQMIGRQENIQKSTAEADPGNESTRRQLSESQDEVTKELSNTEQAMTDLKKRMDEFAKEMPLEQLEEARQMLDSSHVASEMAEASKQLSQGQFSKSMSAQNRISSALKNLRQQLSETQRSMLQNQQKATVDALRKAQQNLLEISKEQESLRDKSAGIIPNSAESRGLSDRQNELMQQLGYTAQQMMQLSDKSFAVTPQMGRQIGEAYTQMQQALGKLQSRSGESPTQAQNQAMGAMNQAVMGIQSTLQSMMQGRAGGGFPSLMQQLQQLAGQQEGLNALTMQIGQQGSLSMEQQAELARLAAQQASLRKSLEQLASEASQSQSQNRVLGNLNDIAKEMDRVVSDMHNRNITRETISRQEKILSHLLDASRSIRQRDYDNRRVTRAGTDVITQSPGPLDLTNPGSEEEQMLLKLIHENFPPEYQQVILRYYRLLMKTPE